MAPIPPKQKKNIRRQTSQSVSTDNVFDELGYSMSQLLQRQRRTNQKQEKDTTIARQHASQYESDSQKNKLIYRDVFPGRKYKLTLNAISWVSAQNTIEIGTTFEDEFTLRMTIDSTEDFDNNTVEIDLSGVSTDIDTLEVRLNGATSTVRGYLEDTTSSDSISGAISRILDSIADLISGQSGLEDHIAALEEAVGIPYSDTDTLADRVTALENGT